MKKKGNSQKKLINELQNQLLIQAERLGVRDQYTPLALEEMNLDAIRKILTEFYMERANLEYEIHMLGTDKKELLIKLERLNAYIAKGERIRDGYLQKIEKLLAQGLGEKDKAIRVADQLTPVKIKVAA